MTLAGESWVVVSVWTAASNTEPGTDERRQRASPGRCDETSVLRLSGRTTAVSNRLLGNIAVGEDERRFLSGSARQPSPWHPSIGLRDTRRWDIETPIRAADRIESGDDIEQL